MNGGNDSGAIGITGLTESEVTLTIALKVADILKRHNINAILTRNKDIRVELADRVKIANNNNADYFISIHCNSSSNPTACGTETYAYYSSIAGSKLATYVQNTLTNEIKLVDRGIKYSDFYVLKNTNMPAILVEVAFISNLVEEKLLKSEEFLDKVRVGIAKGILQELGVDYIKELDEIKLNLHGKEMIVDGYFKNGINYVPIRLLEKLGRDVEWKNNTVYISYKK